MIDNNNLTITYNSSTIKSTTSSGFFKLPTKGKFMSDDITIAATIEEPTINDATAAASDIRSGVIGYNNNGQVVGTMASYNGGVEVNEPESYDD